jgi:proteasome lid subunit RPN8/RPN11
MILLVDEALEAIRLHGRESYRDEACGVLYGRLDAEGRHVQRAAPMVNAREDERHRRFVVTPDAYRRAEAEASRSGFTLLGFYHSHPDHPAFPSRYDLEHALPFFSYVILSVDGGEPREMRSFVLSEDRSEFLEEPLHPMRAERSRPPEGSAEARGDEPRGWGTAALNEERGER